MLRSIARVVVPVGMVLVSVLASLADAQISPNLPNPTGAPNPLTTTLSIFRSNMQDKIMKAADAMPESKYSYRPTKDVRSFGELVTHIADIYPIFCVQPSKVTRTLPRLPKTKPADLAGFSGLCLVAQTITRWNQIVSWLQEVDLIRRNGGLRAA
ncbi:MAG: hypothetical protein WA824_04100 [Candidatus Sulfotelmatobacter sp.]